MEPFLGILGIAIGGVFALFIILASIFWIGMLISALLNKGLSDIEKLMWVLLIFFSHFIGAVLYFFIGRPKRLARS